MKLRYKYIAVDFDDTIATDAYPEIGKLKPHADVVLRKVKELGGKICIWTCRNGEDELKVKAFLEKHNIPWDVFNEPFPEIIEKYSGSSRKIFADLYIDDKGIHSIDKGIDWYEIEKLLFITPEINVGDKLICIKDGMNGFAIKDNIYEITHIQRGITYTTYVIDDVIGTDLDIIFEFFRKV